MSVFRLGGTDRTGVLLIMGIRSTFFLALVVTAEVGEWQWGAVLAPEADVHGCDRENK